MRSSNTSPRCARPWSPIARSSHRLSPGLRATCCTSSPSTSMASRIGRARAGALQRDGDVRGALDGPRRRARSRAGHGPRRRPSDLASRRCRPAVDEQVLSTTESRLDLLLALDRHAEVLSEVEALVEREPFRERLRAQQMLALYRAHRQSDALTVFRATRSLLVEELGVEPGRALRELEQAILRQDPTLDSPAAATRPVEHDPRRRPIRARMDRAARRPGDRRRRLDGDRPEPRRGDSPGRQPRQPRARSHRRRCRRRAHRRPRLHQRHHGQRRPGPDGRAR